MVKLLCLILKHTKANPFRQWHSTQGTPLSVCMLLPNQTRTMPFSLSGQLIITASKLGHDFHIFRLLPHPTCPALGSVHHLYILHRGDTTATVSQTNLITKVRFTHVTRMQSITPHQWLPVDTTVTLEFTLQLIH